MTPDQINYVHRCMDIEGFHYCFCSYSWFEEIEDEEFHKLRKAYVDAAFQLREYIENHE